MSEENSAEYDEFNENTEFESHLSDSDTEYEEVDEEISTDEVDRVLESLIKILESVESATIHEYLEETYNQIFGLVYEEDEVEESELEGPEEKEVASDFEEENELEEDSVKDAEYDGDFEDEDLLDEEAA
jgi:hypothetical protein